MAELLASTGAIWRDMLLAEALVVSLSKPMSLAVTAAECECVVQQATPRTTRSAASIGAMQGFDGQTGTRRAGRGRVPTISQPATRNEIDLRPLRRLRRRVHPNQHPSLQRHPHCSSSTIAPGLSRSSLVDFHPLNDRRFNWLHFAIQV